MPLVSRSLPLPRLWAAVQAQFPVNGVVTRVRVVIRPAKRSTRRSIVRAHRAIGVGRTIVNCVRWCCRDWHRWSPEIISARLCLDYPNTPQMRISAETIYQWVYRDAAHGGHLYRQLWRRRPHRRRHHDRLPAHSRIANRVDISQRPAIVDQRSRVGDWEGDMVVSRKNRGGLVTHVERATRFLVAGRARNKQATTFTAITHALLHWVPKPLCQTLTLDNGTENAGHEEIAQHKGMAVYFADPHAPWQRGSNEQINGLIRRYFPKGTDFRKVSDAQVEQVVLAINQRPRKCLHYQSPYDVFAEALRGALAT